MKSMTGYGSATEILGGREITAEIRSVNSRYLDCSVKLPRAFSFAEDPAKQLVKRHITRGKADVYITVNTPEGTDALVSVNRPVLEGYLAAMRSIAEEYGVRDDVTVSTLARMPDVFTIDKLQKDILAVLENALTRFDQMREQEGTALAADLRAKAEGFCKLVERVEERTPETLAAYRRRLTEKLQEVLGDTNIDESRILTEAAIYADKIAVDEETVRLRSHLKQLEQMLAAQEPIGRKLDFLLQEMNRETNTIGSKGNDLEQAKTVVEMKAELEKIREQIQNIE
ncbi:MAG: YicC/YloC family endoribonuclease [Oscillospiraceae bacterium]|nr:YicC/YloC family endoribonuclease [Oscillospiraceae bacterium]